MSAIAEVARQFFEACDAGKGWGACRAYCTPDATFVAQAEPLANLRTLQEYADWMNWLMKVLPDGRYVVKSFAIDEERQNVSVFGVFSGTHTGEDGPCPPTGKTTHTDCDGFCRGQDPPHDQDLECRVGGEGARLGLDVWFQALMVLPTFLHEGMPNGSGSSLQRHARHADRLMSIRLHILVGRELDERSSPRQPRLAKPSISSGGEDAPTLCYNFIRPQESWGLEYGLATPKPRATASTERHSQKPTREPARSAPNNFGGFWPTAMLSSSIRVATRNSSQATFRARCISPARGVLRPVSRSKRRRSRVWPTAIRAGRWCFTATARSANRASVLANAWSSWASPMCVGTS